METKIETTNQGGEVLAYDGDQIVGQLDFAFDGNVLKIEHTRAYVEGVGVGSLLVNAANDYAINHSLKVLPICSFAYAWYSDTHNSRIFYALIHANELCMSNYEA